MVVKVSRTAARDSVFIATNGRSLLYGDPGDNK
jgi:hypothetical protein